MDYLKRLQQVQYEMLLEVDRICKENEISYSIVAGTLLGAVRHGGFIPWDDDLDIGMTRENYEKFLNVAYNTINDKYFIQNMKTDKYFALPITKIRKNGTICRESNLINPENGIHEGIFIDIFPFDNVPESKFKKIIHSSKLYILKRILLAKLDYKLWREEDYIKKNIYKLIKVASNFIKCEELKIMIYKESTKYNNFESNYIVAVGGSYGYKRETIKKCWLDDLKEINFNNTKVKAISKYDDYLKKLYGNYMILPPVDQRGNRHGIVKLSFGDEK